MIALKQIKSNQGFQARTEERKKFSALTLFNQLGGIM